MIHVEVVYALRDEQALVTLELPEGATVGEAVDRSGLLARFPEIDLRHNNKLGVFGRVTTPATLLRDGDRVEIYRPLTIDPREARRGRAGARKGSARREEK